MSKDKVHCDYIPRSHRGLGWDRPPFSQERSDVAVCMRFSLSSSLSLAHPLCLSLTHSHTLSNLLCRMEVYVNYFQLIFILQHMVVTTSMVKTTNWKKIAGNQ